MSSGHLLLSLSLSVSNSHFFSINIIFTFLPVVLCPLFSPTSCKAGSSFWESELHSWILNKWWNTDTGWRERQRDREREQNDVTAQMWPAYITDPTTSPVSITAFIHSFTDQCPQVINLKWWIEFSSGWTRYQVEEPSDWRAFKNVQLLSLSEATLQ